MREPHKPEATATEKDLEQAPDKFEAYNDPVFMEKVRRLALERLEEKGILKKIGDDYIFDKELLFKNSLDHFRIFHNGKKSYFGQLNFFTSLSDLYAYDKNDYENDKTTAKKRRIFYQPDDFDEQSLRNDDSIACLTDFKQTSWRGMNEYFLRQYGISAEEATLAYAILNKSKGAGYRDENGRLLVKNNENVYAPITGDWIMKNAGLTTTTSTQKFTAKWTSPQAAILDSEYDHIRQSGLLTTDDFEQKSVSERANKLLRRESLIGRKGYIFLEGAKYTLGSKFENKTLVKLEDNTYGIGENINGVLKITHWFEPLSPIQIEQKRQIIEERVKRGEIKRGRSISASVAVGVNEINIREYRPSSLSNKREDETAEDYADRLHNIGNYEQLSRLSKDLAEQTGIGLHNLQIHEQEWLAGYANQSPGNRDRLFSFAKTFGLDGLRSFTACEYGHNMGDQLIDLSKRADQGQAETLFKRYAELNKKAQLAEATLAQIDYQGLSPELAKKLPQEISEAILRRSKDLLMSVMELLAKPRAEVGSKKKALASLEALADMLEIIFSLSEQSTQTRFEKVRDGNAPKEAGNNTFTVYDRDRDAIYKLRTFVRPEADKDGQARVNFELIYDTIKPDKERQALFQQETTHAPNIPAKTKKQQISSLRLGLDLETGGSQPAMSLDIGRSAFKGQTLIRTGDIIGNLLANYDRDSGHHTTASFKTEFAQPENFAIIAESIQNWIGQK